MPLTFCNFSIAASQKLVVSYLITTTYNNFCCDRYCWFEALFDIFLRCLTGFFLPFFLSISTSRYPVFNVEMVSNSTERNTRLYVLTHDIHMYTHIQYMYTHKYIAIIIGLTLARAIRESLCSPIDNLVTIIGRVREAFNELLKKIGFWTCETKTNCFTHFSQTITFQAKVFQGKFSTMTIFILCKLCVNL